MNQAAELTAATVALDETRLVLTYRISGDLPERGHWLASTTLTGGENGPIQQFGFKLVDGRLASAFLFDHVAAIQKKFDATPGRVGDRWTIVFPRAEVAVKSGGVWRADLEVDGADSGTVEGRV
jgi:hypothetical protein